MFSGAGVGVASPRAQPQQAPEWGLHTCPQKQGLGSSLCLCLHTHSSFPSGSAGKEPVCQCRRLKRHRLDPWVRKILWRRKWQLAPVSLQKNPADRGPGGLQSMVSQRVGRNWIHVHTNVCVVIVLCFPRVKMKDLSSICKPWRGIYMTARKSDRSTELKHLNKQHHFVEIG